MDPVARRLMAAALGLAARRIGAVGARPAVGAIVASGTRVLGRGATGPDGRPHAETVALADAAARYGKRALQGAAVYVTLEPCAHWGRTPPCTDALIAAGVGRVVVPHEDPDPRVSGRGIAALRQAGITVETGAMAEEARKINCGFLSRIERGRPWLTLKLAATLDGRIATAAGESRWITGPAARARVHLMRLRSDAVMVGSGTARADDPTLDVRGFGSAPAQPLRVVVDAALSLSPDSRLALTAQASPLLMLHSARAPARQRQSLAARGVELCEVAEGPGGHLDLAAALAQLGQRGINTLLCEGGGRLAAALLQGGLVDEIALFTAGRCLGADGIPAVGTLGLEALAHAPGFVLEHLEQVDDDVLTRWRLA